MSKAWQTGHSFAEIYKAEQNAKTQAAKQSAQAKLTVLGLTADDLKALGL